MIYLLRWEGLVLFQKRKLGMWRENFKCQSELGRGHGGCLVRSYSSTLGVNSYAVPKILFGILLIMKSMDQAITNSHSRTLMSRNPMVIL